MLARKSGGPELRPPHPVKSRAWWHVFIIPVLGGGDKRIWGFIGQSV